MSPTSPAVAAPNSPLPGLPVAPSRYKKPPRALLFRFPFLPELLVPFPPAAAAVPAPRRLRHRVRRSLPHPGSHSIFPNSHRKATPPRHQPPPLAGIVQPPTTAILVAAVLCRFHRWLRRIKLHPDLHFEPTKPPPNAIPPCIRATTASRRVQPATTTTLMAAALRRRRRQHRHAELHPGSRSSSFNHHRKTTPTTNLRPPPHLPPPVAVPDHLAMRRRLLRLCNDEESLGCLLTIAIPHRNAICPARGELRRRACCLRLPTPRSPNPSITFLRSRRPLAAPLLAPPVAGAPPPPLRPSSVVPSPAPLGEDPLRLLSLSPLSAAASRHRRRWPSGLVPPTPGKPAPSVADFGRCLWTARALGPRRRLGRGGLGPPCALPLEPLTCGARVSAPASPADISGSPFPL
uniref:Uncharacterized protein n=1 Tax=Oryza sativa subsp. japonica TaxID=39947 RepID=Q5Z444_ORYSJ|nr:hypothetical protein [Oryza sativa Japonica Group]